jgi:hypothetical protein
MGCGWESSGGSSFQVSPHDFLEGIMCLSRITRRVSKPSKKEKVGYKVYSRDGGTLYSQNYSVDGKQNTEAVPTNKWLRAKATRVYPDFGRLSYYSTGFHVYQTKEEAMEHSYGAVVVPVLVREVTYYGTQCGAKVMVARKMFVPEVYIPEGK